MGSKKTGAASATGTTTTKVMSKANVEKPPPPRGYKNLNQVLSDFTHGEQPRGSKFIIGEKATQLVTMSRGVKLHFTFEGTPAEFAQVVLKQRGIRSEIIDGGAPVAPPADDGE